MPQHLLLIPGLLSDYALWQHQIDALSDIATCHVADSATHNRIDLIAKDILAKAPERFALAGLSMGGYLALEIMRQAPERVERLCLLNTSARQDTPEQRQRRSILLSLSTRGTFKGVTPRLLPLLIHPERISDVVLTQTIMDMAERVGREAFQNQQTAILNRIDSRPYLKDIKCPVQLVGGMQDAISRPEYMEEMETLIPHARLAMLDGCGHLSTMEHPEKTTAIMRVWLIG